MKTFGTKVSMDFRSMEYTIHLYDNDLCEFRTVTESMPGPMELYELAEGFIMKVIEIPEEYVNLPKELFKDILTEMRKYLI